MKTTYRALAWLIMALVAIQAAVIAYGFFGLGAWISSGNDMTEAALDSTGTGITGEAGLMVHSIVGMYVLPLVGLVMLVVSFFVHTRAGITWAALILVDTIVQVVLAFAAFGVATLGILHGLNAFLLLWLAVMALRAVGDPGGDHDPSVPRSGSRTHAPAQ